MSFKNVLIHKKKSKKNLFFLSLNQDYFPKIYHLPKIMICSLSISTQFAFFVE